LSVKEPQLPDNIKQRNIKTTEFRSDKSEIRQYQGQKRANRFYTELRFEEKLPDEQYLMLLKDICHQNEDVIILPYCENNNRARRGGEKSGETVA
jgi:hypothetical protein